MNVREISSANDQATYTSVNELCHDNTDYRPIPIFPIDTNVWELYAAGIESPAGTYTFTQNDIVHQVVIEDELPKLIVFAFGSTKLTLNIDNFRNKAPEFSTFSLPSECSRFFCIACYNSAVTESIGIMLLLTTPLMYLFTTL